VPPPDPPPAEAPLGALSAQPLVAPLPQRAPLGPDRDHITLHGKLHVVGVDPGQVEVDEERVAAPVGLHRHRARPPTAAQHLPTQPVELLERIETEHGHATTSLVLAGFPVAAAGCGQAAGLAVTPSPRGG